MVTKVDSKMVLNKVDSKNNRYGKYGRGYGRYGYRKYGYGYGEKEE